MIILLILSASIPPLLVAYLIYHFDKYQREEVKHLILPFLGGMLIVPIAYFLENSITDFFPIDLNIEYQTFLLSFFGISFVEEALKTIVFFTLVYHRPFFDEAFDGFVYALFIGMGFALVENMIYVWEFGLSTALIRAFTAVPAHAVFGMVAGYYFAKAKFDKANSIKLISIGFGLAVLIHGLYDFLILQTMSEPLMAGSAVLIYGIAIGCWIIMKRVLKEAAPVAVDQNTDRLAKIPKVDNEDFTDDVIKKMKE